MQSLRKELLHARHVRMQQKSEAEIKVQEL